jgi:hypothetical protein
MAETTSELAPNNGMAEKALAVAKDVLSHLNEYQLITGRYVVGTIDSTKIVAETDLRSLVDTVQKECCVCALGACFLSKARLFDKVPANEILRPYDWSTVASIDVRRPLIEKHLSDVFSPTQLNMIESAFEMRVRYHDMISEDEHARLRVASAFGQRFVGDKKARVIAVMQNIIDNGGTFVVDPVGLDEYLDSDDEGGDDDTY